MPKRCPERAGNDLFFVCALCENLQKPCRINKQGVGLQAVASAWPESATSALVRLPTEPRGCGALAEARVSRHLRGGEEGRRRGVVLGRGWHQVGCAQSHDMGTGGTDADCQYDGRQVRAERDLRCQQTWRTPLHVPGGKGQRGHLHRISQAPRRWRRSSGLPRGRWAPHPQGGEDSQVCGVSKRQAAPVPSSRVLPGLESRRTGVEQFQTPRDWQVRDYWT